MKRLWALILCGLAAPCAAQFTDDFSDGDFTANPAWIGDVGDFTVNASNQLQLAASAAGNAYLSASANATSLNNMEWRFYVRLSFSPSANNFGRVYLVSDQPDLTGSLDGYYLQFGESLSNDAIELFRQSGTATTSVARGTDGFIASSFEITVRVTRDMAGAWSIFADPAAGSNYALQATGTDATFSASDFLGVWCTYTMSNISGFYFDDFYFGPQVVDTIPPGIQSIAATGPMDLDVEFTEPVEQVTAENAMNYSVDNGIGNPSMAVRDAGNTALVHLTFATSFQNGFSHTLTVSNVEDQAGNAISSANAMFTYTAPVTASAHDVVINEVFFEFGSPQGLPMVEYVELFNRSAKAFNLDGWTIEDAAANTALFGPVSLSPGGYLIVCPSVGASQLMPFGNTTGLSGFPGLNDNGDDILLRDDSGTIIDQLTYDQSSYNDPDRDGGGYSIERVDPDFTCAATQNWHACQMVIGGTPGTLNSVDGTITDSEPPRLVRAFISGAAKVTAVFSEPMSAAQLTDASNYSISGWGMPVVAIALSSERAQLEIAGVFDTTTIYELTADPAFADCPGNTIGTRTTEFGYPHDPAVSDVLINEMLYDPYEDGNEFLELYNRSEKIIDLSLMRLCKVDRADNKLKNQLIMTTDPYLLFPGDYVVVSKGKAGITPYYSTPDPDAFLDMDGFPEFVNSEDELAIINLSGIRVDQFYYNEDYQFPLLQDDKGVSLERISFDRATQDPTNWHSASEPAGFATPGYVNSQHSETMSDGGEVSIFPELFSPDNDGRDDVVQISYRFEQPGYVANLRIFNAHGREIIYLVKNELLGVEGTFSWDGLNEERGKAPSGIYVMFMEVFNDMGSVKRYKIPLVLASRL